MDGVDAHTDGYSGGLSGTLDKDTVPMHIDFESDPVDNFAVALGYSADKDPAFRYCTNEIETIKGVPWYTNLWIDQCGMTGGASGGSWLVNMDTDGVGTIVSVNSWGFTDKVGNIYRFSMSVLSLCMLFVCMRLLCLFSLSLMNEGWHGWSTVANKKRELCRMFV